MRTHINRISEVTLELEVEATAEELAPDLDASLRRKRKSAEMKGFRRGKVPMGLVKKIHGADVARELALDKAMEACRKEVYENERYDVIGRAAVTTLDYEIDGDLRAAVRFGLRPDIAIKDLSGEKIPRLKYDVTDEDVTKHMERMRRMHAPLVPAETEEIGEEFQVVLDMQRLDDQTGGAVIGEKEEGVTFFMDDEGLRETLREGALGKRTGDTFAVEIPPEEDDEGPARRYQATVREVKRRDLPDLDDAFAQKATGGQASDLDEWKNFIRERLNDLWRKRAQELLVDRIIDRMIALHDIPIPESAVEMYLDDMVYDVKQSNNGKAPSNFDEQFFRVAQRNAAGKKAKWHLIRHAYIERENIEVTEDDLDAWFDKAAEADEAFTPEMLRRHFERSGRIDEMREHMLSRKVFEHLADAFELEDMEPDELQALLEEDAAPDSRVILPG